MKMENSRLTFLEPEFTTFMRTSSDPNAQGVRNIRAGKSLPNTRSLSTSPEGRNLNLPKSPQISKLTRADSYRVKPKETTVVTMSNIERRRKSKERRRMRSQSSPMFPQDLDVTDPNLGKTTDNVSNESLKENDSDCKRSPMNGRKKSFNALKELKLKKLIQETTRPILNRSQSQKFADKPVVIRHKNFATDDDDSDEAPKKPPQKPSGPLFQATTLFVPGYDFKTKSSTLPRKSSTPQLPRRSSKERMSVLFDKVITRQASSPCLLKRDSKEKMKKVEHQIEEKILELPPEYTRTPTITLSSETNERISSSPDDDVTDACLVNQRKAALALRQQQFREKGTTKSLDCGTPTNSKVKQIASGYDDGSAFVKVRNLANKTSELTLKDNAVDNLKDNAVDNESMNKHTDSYTILEKPYDVDYRPTRSYNGTESGYASLTDSMNLDKDPFANSWSHHDWRDFSTDLCVTEL